MIVSNNLLESLWARVDTNIGARIKQISELLTQALSANTEATSARDAAVAAEQTATTAATNAASSEAAAKSAESSASSHAQSAQASATNSLSAAERAEFAAEETIQQVEGDFATRNYVDDSVANALRVDTTVGTRIFFGEHMIHGDTGWREVEPINGWTGGLYIRRVNDMVSYRGVISAESATHGNAWDIPAGFRAGTLLSTRGQGYDYGRAIVSTDGNAPEVRNMNFYFSRFTISGYSTAHSYWINVAYSTTNAWPTSLPGTPA